MNASESLIEAMDASARELLKLVNPPTIEAGSAGEPPQPIDPKGRVEAFKAVTDYLAVKHKIEPKGTKPSGIDGYARRINGASANGTTRRRGRGSAASEGDEASDE